jgi:starch phosphorylase
VVVDAVASVATSGFEPGSADLTRRKQALAARLTPSLRPLAEVAYNYRWSWHPDGAALFRDISTYRWERSGHNPVRFLNDLWPSTQELVEQDGEIRERVEALAADVAADLARPDRTRAGIAGPVAFFCSEFGIHTSLPLYSGGLGVLAGDILKEASDQAFPLIGIGLLYGRGYFRQRLDVSGRQQEYWLTTEQHSLPAARVTQPDGAPLVLTVPLFERELSYALWRVDVGRVPLLLLDADVPANDAVQRWTTGRLYEANRAVRLAQYGLLGIGGMRALRALGIEPAAIHLNEGHPALAALELAAEEVDGGAALEAALETARRRVVFTTHTPVAAGNETYEPDEFAAAYGDLAARLGLDRDRFLGLCRVDPEDVGEPPGMTPLALRLSRRRNAVSQLHGEVARQMWQRLFGAEEAVDVPIAHVTNGVHVPTFAAAPMRRLLDRHLGAGWATSADPQVWEAVRAIPNAELWAARCEARSELVDYVRTKNQQDRLLRGEQIDYVRNIGLDADTLTLGFARRLATYKRLHLLAHDPDRAERLIGGDPGVQLLVAGKAHPSDEAGKDTLQALFRLKRHSPVAQRIVVVEDYDLEIARMLVAGCDVWINLPRKPMEASGTSGMKATFNGGLQLSVLDGWWAEAYDGTNGWAIPGDGDPDPAAADAHDARRFYELLEREVIPLFHERDANGVPQAWCERIKDALVSCGPRFSATRMLDDYVERIYPQA